MRKERRRTPRASVHAQAMIDYAGGDREKSHPRRPDEEGWRSILARGAAHLQAYSSLPCPGKASTCASQASLYAGMEWARGIQFVDVPQSSLRAMRAWLRLNVRDDSERRFSF